MSDWVSASYVRGALYGMFGWVDIKGRMSGEMRTRLRAGLIECRATALVQLPSKELIWNDWLTPRALWSAPGELQLDSDRAFFTPEIPERLSANLRDCFDIELVRLHFHLDQFLNAFDLELADLTDMPFRRRGGAQSASQANDNDDGFSRASLPKNAKPSHIRDSEYAHAAAELVATQRITVAEAIRRVRPSDPTRTEASIDRVIRGAFDLMYDRDGRPIKK